MSLATVKITRTPGAANAEQDSARLKMDLNADNQYAGTFTGNLIWIHDSNTMYVVKDTSLDLVIVRKGEVTILTVI